MLSADTRILLNLLKSESRGLWLVIDVKGETL